MAHDSDPRAFLPLTKCQVFYILVAHGVVPKTEAAHRAILEGLPGGR